MIFIDVRTKGEYDRGHIEGAILHDIMDIMQGVYPDVDKDEKIILYCESGNRSMMAKNFMESAGYTNVIDGGGMDELMKNLV
jgi:phage shock protein E